MSDREKPLYYGDYLQLEKLLSAQDLESEKIGRKAHDEMLFIVVHQAYELWFKQILWELDAIATIFCAESVEEKDLGRAVSHLERIISIQRLFSLQIDILETMTPLDFLDFRDILFPASGFQSAQWRKVENRMGMREQDRMQFSHAGYTSRFSDQDRTSVLQSEQQPSLFTLVEGWLERTPFIQLGDFDFWRAYRGAVETMLSKDRELILNNPNLSDEEKKTQIDSLQKTDLHFGALFDADQYRELKDKRLSHKALQAALLIHLYRDEPILHLPFRLLNLLVDIDENFSAWRYRHALMAGRMIGTKIGTGGSAGHDYLRKAAEHNKIFRDLTNLSTFFIPRSALPELPEPIVRQMGFRYS